MNFYTEQPNQLYEKKHKLLSNGVLLHFLNQSIEPDFFVTTL